MPDILGTAEHPKCKAIEKFPLAQNTMGGLDCEPSFILQISAQLV